MSVLYQLYEFNLHQWKIICYDSFSDTIKKNPSEIEKLINFVAGNDKIESFKWALELGGIQFLVGVFPEDKVLRFASKQLSYELNLLNQDLPDKESIKNHATAIAELSLQNSPTVIEYITFQNKLPDFLEDKFDAVHQKERQLSEELIQNIKSYKQSWFERISDFGLDLTANYMLIRIHLLKFLAILPNLDHDKSGKEVKRIFLETLRRLISDSQLADSKKLKGQKRRLPKFYVWVVKSLLGISQFISPSLLAGLLRRSVGMMAKRFIAGEDIEKATKALGQLRSSMRDATIDQLGELVVSKGEADLYLARVLEIIAGLNRTNIRGEKNQAGILRSHVSIKVSALAHDFKPQDFLYSYEQIAPRLIQILEAAQANHVFINIDAEHYHYRDGVFDVFKKVLMETQSLISYDQVGIVVQAYLRDGINHLEEVINLAQMRKLKMPIRLVKGAYWDAETIEAEAHNFMAPQFLNKEETDIHFRQLIYRSLEASDDLILAVASHNIGDHCFAESLRSELFPDAGIIEHQCLHMTYEGLSIGMAKMDWPTRNYIPIGDLLVGMAYLVRRIMENSSQVGVLTIMRSHKKGLKFNLPNQIIKDKKAENEYVNDSSLNDLSKRFKNIYPIRTYLRTPFSSLRDLIQKDYDNLKQGILFVNDGETSIYSSSYENLLIGRIQMDTPEEAQKKVKQVFGGFENTFWSTSPEKRFAILHKVADLLLVEREKLTSLIMLEAGKTVDEAVADVDEAIDFIQFYIRQQIKIEKTHDFAPRGVVGVIAPWNFPLAIPCGMTIAALVAGNTAVLKPAEQTMMIAKKFVDICHRAGIPEDVLQLSLGEGDVGAAIVDHPLVTGVVFTGSRAVGEMIYRKISCEQTSKKYDYEPMNKFAITEMGGKNGIIVTNNCELDETVSGIIYAAFAHAGQKCSAASRIIIDNEIKPAFLKRFVKAIEDLPVGGALDFSTMVNPLIAKEDQQRVRDMAKRSREECEKYHGIVHIDRSLEEYSNTCVGPSLFELSKDVVLDHATVATDEVFGPLLHLVGYDTLDEAIEIFNSTPYALTGGVYCQSQDDIDYLVPRLECGNIYINRPNTGARVAIEPFGGFKMSGTGPKAGGKEYLYQFNRLKEVVAQDKILFEKEAKDLVIPEYYAYPSKLSLERRLYNARKLIQSLEKQFEVYFRKIEEQDKEKLASLRKSILKGEFDLSEREFPNRYIPGQLSYNRKDMNLGKGFLIDDKDNLDLQVVIDLIINLIVGNGITILATNREAFKKWEKVCKLCYLHGFSSFNLALGYVDYLNLTRIFKEQQYQFVLFTGKEIDSDLKKTIFKREEKNTLVKVFTSGYRKNWDQGISTFTHTRSFAINTMRHGAPLELTL